MKGINGIIAANQHPVMQYAVRNSKFAAEKVCMETEKYLVHFDGILFSHNKPASASERFDLLTSLYESHGAQLTAHLKGQFDLVIWDKAACRVLVSNDLFSKRSLYYFTDGETLFYTASYYDLLDLLSQNGVVQPALNEKAVREMAENGVLAGAGTYATGVSYLDAYQALEFDLKTGSAALVSIEPKNSYTASGMEEAVRIFDELFTSAVKAQFAKNAEYGYEHFIALSGGMDSRACLLKAVQCGCDWNITCFNYSQSGSIDNTVSQQIAFDHHLDYLFYPMNAAVFITRLSQAMDANECQQSAIGSTGAGTFARLLDTSRSGLIHVGLCGGELMGDLVECRFASRIQKVKNMLGLYTPSSGDCRFKTREYLDNVRACQNFASMFLSECETVSPFLDEDVVQFVLSLPPQLLYRRSLYREWMKQHIPNDYPTTMFCGPVSISPMQEMLRKVADRIIRRIAGASRRDMNPIEYWMKNHPHLARQCEADYHAGIKALEVSGVSAEILGILQKNWQTDGEHQLYVLTAIRALQDILSRW